MKKPRVRFCWDCGRQLYGRHHAEVMIDGHMRIIHKSCSKIFKTKEQSADVTFKKFTLPDGYTVIPSGDKVKIYNRWQSTECINNSNNHPEDYGKTNYAVCKLL